MPHVNEVENFLLKYKGNNRFILNVKKQLEETLSLSDNQWKFVKKFYDEKMLRKAVRKEKKRNENN